MSVFLTSAGFTKLSQPEIRANLEAEHRIVFGSGVDLSPEGPLGQSIAISSKYLADTWEGAAEVYSSRDPDTATGVALDELYAEIGLRRLEPTPARAPGVYLWTTYAVNFTIPQGSSIKAASGDVTYSLVSDAEVSGNMLPTGTFQGLRLRLKSTYAPSDVVSFTVSGENVFAAYGSFTSVSALAAELVNDTNALAGGYAASVFEDSGNVYVQILRDTAFVLSDATNFASDTTWQAATIADFICDTYGANSVPALSLNTIATPVSDWLSVYQPVAGVPGTATETDTDFRMRAKRGFRSGTATEDAIWAALYRVDGVSRAVVTSNRESVTDSEGRPAKSFECVVEGGADTAISQAIWDTMPAGIEAYGYPRTGADIPLATGKDGRTHPVNFSRPDPKYAWARITITALNSEEAPPSELVRSVQEAIALWGNANFRLGDNYIRQKLYAPLFSVPGIEGATIAIAITDDAEDTPSYTFLVTALPVASREFLSFAVDRVEVVI